MVFRIRLIIKQLINETMKKIEKRPKYDFDLRQKTHPTFKIR